MKPLDRSGQTCEFDEMAKFRSSYVCQNCGAITQRWQGKCESCGEWNTIIEEGAALGIGGAAARKGAAGRPFPLEDLSGASKTEPRLVTGIGELDRVAGGGFVPGSATLIGGEPGIGKSTLLIQACAAVARSGGRVVYVSGEESTAQVRLRAARLRACRCARAARGANVRRGHRGDARLGRRAEIRGDRFHPDHVERRDRIGAWDGEPGARFGAGADPLRQGERRGFAARRACDQGRPDRRARASSSIWWTRSSPSRATARTPSGSCGRPRTGSARPTRSACSR